MATFFIDSSALVKRYQNEEGSSRVAELAENAEQLLITRLTIVEVSAALVRRARATRLSLKELTATLADLDQDVAESFKIVELEESVMASAVDLAKKHGLRGADAIQLACALLARNEAGDSEFALLSSDEELNAASAAEGLQVQNPLQHP
jgi:hypothetical protein